MGMIFNHDVVLQQQVDVLTAQQWLDVLLDCAHYADDVACHYYHQRSVVVEKKQDQSVVTEADKKIEADIRSFFSQQFPSVGIVGEEYELSQETATIKLIIDPIDATSNFVCGIPIFACLLAIEKNKEIIAGVVSNGVSKERWVASLNGGSFYNEQPIQVSSVRAIAESQAFFGSLYGREARGNVTQLQRLLSKTRRQRGIGDFLMHMWVANGYGEFGIDFGLKPWDLAPLGIIVTEAGGCVTAVDGQPFSIYEGSIVSSNNHFHTQIIEAYNS